MYIIYILAGAIIGAAAAAWAIGRRLAAGQKENARLTVENSQQATELRLTAQRLAEAEARLAEAEAEAKATGARAEAQAREIELLRKQAEEYVKEKMVSMKDRMIKTAENVAKYCAKGTLVGVDGRLNQRSYEDKSGQKRSVVEVIAESVQFLERKGANDEVDGQPEETAAKSTVAHEGIDSSDDDLPF